jgi:hypothetical protein
MKGLGTIEIKAYHAHQGAAVTFSRHEHDSGGVRVVSEKAIKGQAVTHSIA